MENKVADMQCLPDNLRDRQYYHPTNQGVERRNPRAIGGDQVGAAAGLRMSAARSASRHSRVYAK